MTHGSPAKLIMRFTLPMMLGNVFQQIYSLVDAIVVGQFVGSVELGGISCAGSIDYMLFSLTLGVCAGLGIQISILVGAGDQQRLTKAIYSGVYVLLATAVIMTAVGYFGAPHFLRWTDTPELNYSHALTYMRICMLGSTVSVFYNGISGIMRAFGDTKTPLTIMVVSCVINVVLDLVLVLRYSMGVAGVAIATVIAQSVSVVLGVLFALRNIPIFRPKHGCFAPDRKLVCECIRLGVPMAIQNLLVAFSTVVLQSVINSFGERVVAANMAVTKVEQLLHQPYNCLAMALSTFTGQNIGARKPDRVKQGLKFSFSLMAVFSVVMTLIMFLGGGLFIRLFVDDAEIISIGAVALKITSVFYIFLGTLYVVRGVLNGGGDTVFCAAFGVIELLCRCSMARPLTMIPGVGFWGVFLCTGLTWTITGILGCIRYHSVKRLKFHQ